MEGTEIFMLGFLELARRKVMFSVNIRTIAVNFNCLTCEECWPCPSLRVVLVFALELRKNTENLSQCSRNVPVVDDSVCQCSRNVPVVDDSVCQLSRLCLARTRCRYWYLCSKGPLSPFGESRYLPSCAEIHRRTLHHNKDCSFHCDNTRYTWNHAMERKPGV